MMLSKLSKKLGEALQAQGLKLTTAESCTGGMVAQVVTMMPGSSQWFERGFVTYSNEAKQEMLGVKAETLERYGAVSEQVAREMAEGALRHSRADVALAITGIAGPAGGSDDKPVGTVCVAFAKKHGQVTAQAAHFQGDRESVRQQAAEFGLRHLL